MTAGSIFGLVMIVVVAAGPTIAAIAWLTRPRREAAKQAAHDARVRKIFLDRLTAAEAGGPEERGRLLSSSIPCVGHCHATFTVALEYGLRDRYHAVEHAQRVMHNLQECEQGFREAVTYWRTVESGSKPLIDRIEAAGRVVQARRQLVEENQVSLASETGYNHAAMLRNLQTAIDDEYNRLAALASGSTNDFLELQILIMNVQANKPVCQKDGLKPLPYPTGWNYWVARHNPDPNFKDFVGIPAFSGRNLETWLRRAARALVERNVTEAQTIISTCCATNHQNIPHALSNLLSQLAVMVIEERQRRNWAPKSPTAVSDDVVN
jgi:hypothetical protein